MPDWNEAQGTEIILIRFQFLCAAVNLFQSGMRGVRLENETLIF